MNVKPPIGELVCHKTFGHGRITEVCEQPNHSAVLMVQFFDVPGIKGFKVPDAFITTKYISTSSELVTEWLSTYTAFHCAICERQRDTLQEIDGEHICSECIERLPRCWECGTHMRRNRIGLAINEVFLMKYICTDCATKDYRQCNQCGNMHSISRRKNRFPRISDEVMLCENCIESKTIICDCCEENIFEKDATLVEGHPLCNVCYTKKSYICKTCGQYIFGNMCYPFLEGFCNVCGPTSVYEQYAAERIKHMGECVRKAFHSFQKCASTPLMTRLHKSYHSQYTNAKAFLSEIENSNKDFLYQMQLEHVQRLEKAPPYDTLLIDLWNLTLIVVSDLPQQISNYYEGVITATNFKQSSNYTWMSVHATRKKMKVSLSDGRIAYIWDKPYRFRAVTEFNKDFGMEFHGRYEVVQKDQYGDTSDFYIIGAIES